MSGEAKVGRENVQQKGRRMLTEGRLKVTRVSAAAELQRAAIVASCRGDSGEEYTLGYDAVAKEWRCTCEARRLCSHLVALQLVTTIPTRPA